MIDLFITNMQKFSWLLIAAILLSGWNSPALMVLTFVCMTAPIAFSFYYGRAWCGNFCPRASFSNSVLSVISHRKGTPSQFRNEYFRVLIFILLMTFFAFNLSNSGGTLFGIGRAFLKMLFTTTMLQICFGIFLHQNAWCSICPMGTAAYFIIRLRGRANVNINISQSCVSCGICKGVCPVKIDISKYKSCGEVKNADCMKCRACIKQCPQKALTWSE